MVERVDKGAKRDAVLRVRRPFEQRGNQPAIHFGFPFRERFLFNPHAFQALCISLKEAILTAKLAVFNILTMYPQPDWPSVPGGGQVLCRALVPPLVALDRHGDDKAASRIDGHSGM